MFRRVLFRSDLKGLGRLTPVRKALREAEKQDEAAPPLPDDWPFWHLTRGKRAVMVGGDPRPKSRERIQRAFAFASLEWDEVNESAAERLRKRAGTIDLFVFNRFGRHSLDDILLDEVRADLSRWVRVEHGYGVVGLRHAMEAHWRNLTPR